MSAPADLTRYVLAECTETSRTRCFAVIPPRCYMEKDYMRPRRKIARYSARYGLKAIYPGDLGGDWSWLERSPFWKTPRLISFDQIPTGVEIP